MVSGRRMFDLELVGIADREGSETDIAWEFDDTDAAVLDTLRERIDAAVDDASTHHDFTDGEEVRMDVVVDVQVRNIWRSQP